MEANEPKKEQNTEEMDVMKQFMELLGQQGMKEQSQDFMEVLQYIAGMQLQLSAILLKISCLMAENNIGIFAISTFNTDYVLIKSKNFSKAIELLSKTGYRVAE